MMLAVAVVLALVCGAIGGTPAKPDVCLYLDKKCSIAIPAVEGFKDGCTTIQSKKCLPAPMPTLNWTFKVTATSKSLTFTRYSDGKCAKKAKAVVAAKNKCVGPLANVGEVKVYGVFKY